MPEQTLLEHTMEDAVVVIEYTERKSEKRYWQ